MRVPGRLLRGEQVVSGWGPSVHRSPARSSPHRLPRAAGRSDTEGSCASETGAPWWAHRDRCGDGITPLLGGAGPGDSGGVAPRPGARGQRLPRPHRAGHARHGRHGARTASGRGDRVLTTHIESRCARIPDTVVVSASDLIGASPLVSALFHDEPMGVAAPTASRARISRSSPPTCGDPRAARSSHPTPSAR